MSDELRRPEFELYVRGTDKRLERVEHDLDAAVDRHDQDLRDLAKQRERDLERLAEQREADSKARELALTAAKKAAADALAAALKELGESRNTSWVRRIGAVGAGAGVVASFVAVMELWRSSGR